MSEPKFIPKPGQTDFTNIRYAPVINALVVHGGKILLVKRSDVLKFYPGYWHCIAGFLDDSQSIEDKTREELREELGLAAGDIASIERGVPRIFEAPEYGKTYLTVPVLVHVKTDAFRLDWEASCAAWFAPAEAKKLNLIPGFIDILDQYFP